MAPLCPLQRRLSVCFFSIFPSGYPCCSSFGVVAPGATPGGVRMADWGWRPAALNLREAAAAAREISAYWSQK